MITITGMGSTGHLPARSPGPDLYGRGPLAPLADRSRNRQVKSKDLPLEWLQSGFADLGPADPDWEVLLA